MLKRLLHSPRLAPLKPLVGRLPLLGPWLTRIYHRDKATLNFDFDAWMTRRRRERDSEYPLPAGDAPTFDILTLTFQTEPTVLQKTADSVFAQDYPHWRWVIGDNGSSRPETLALLERIARDPRVVVVRFRENHGIAEGHRLALERCSADYVALLDHDDLLTPDALRVVAWHIQHHGRPDFLYSDEDKCDMRDRHFYPYFKPDFSPALLLDTGYTCHLSVVRREKLIDCGAFTEREVEGTQDWDMAVRLYERGARVVHIPEILYTWRATPTSTATAASAKKYIGTAHRECLTRHLVRRGLADRFEVQPNPMSAVPAIGLWRLRRLAEPPAPLVDVLLAANGNTSEVAATVDDCLRETAYPNFRLRVVGLTSVTDIDAVRAECRCHLPDRMDRVLFELNETCGTMIPEIINLSLHAPPLGQPAADLVAFVPVGSRLLYRDWLWESVGQFELHAQAAMIGGRLFDVGQRVIGGAATFGLAGSVGVAYEGASRNEKGYFCINTVHRNIAAIVNAPWVIRRDAAIALGGFDPRFATAFFEADFAARCHKAGMAVIASPYIAAVGNTRPGFADGVNREWPTLYHEHPDLLRDDPFYSPFVGLGGDSIYQLVKPAARGDFVNSRMQQARTASGDAVRHRDLPSDRYEVSRNRESVHVTSPTQIALSPAMSKVPNAFAMDEWQQSATINSLGSRPATEAKAA
jgi:cellulose synthase/poly-beta-1,6-N-acetylglucosamine synthase-like glycosyltransferase